MFRLIIFAIFYAMFSTNGFAAARNSCVAGTTITCNSGYKVSGSSCVQCKGCSNCTSSDWVDNVVDNYQFKIIRSCNCESCAVSFEYRCMTGYFGTNQTCISCATATGNSAATSTSGSNALITDCFLNSGYSDSDASGSWTYTSDCHYKE